MICDFSRTYREIDVKGAIKLYFLKANINSHIFNVYENNEEVDRIVKLLYKNIKDDVEYKVEEVRADEDGDEFLYEASYKFNSIERLDGELKYTIVGNVVKKSNIYVKDMDEKTGEIKKRTGTICKIRAIQ
ncbi:hypothetical protein ACIQW7_24350 [Peribacillus simplex]|uniref:hypothetical protein n=1 Tax=Peribacillus simplex TaxID=1478 RepID=UPI0037FD7A32